MRRTWLALCALAVFAGGCADPVGPDDGPFVNLRPLEPVPHTYPTWYQATEACLGRVGDYAAARWFVADSIHGGTLVGIIALPDTIVMERGYERVEWAVRVQMVYHILGMDDGRGGGSVGDICY